MSLPPGVAKVFKGIGAMTAIGGGLLATGMLLRSRPKAPLEGLSDQISAVLSSDTDLYGLVERLSAYRRLAPESYEYLAYTVALLLELEDGLTKGTIVPQIRFARLAAQYIGTVIERIRVIRIAVQQRARSELDAFDDIASSFQKSCNDHQFNITAQLQRKMAGW